MGRQSGREAFPEPFEPDGLHDSIHIIRSLPHVAAQTHARFQTALYSHLGIKKRRRGQMSERRICLVSTLHLSYNPRLMKEADALHEAGYAVRVVAMREETAKAAWDDELMTARKWRLQRIDVCRDNLPGRARWIGGGLRQRLYQRSGFFRRLRHGSENALNRYFAEMCSVVSSEPADLFIAHNLQALPVAAFAARKWKARLGFDAEDFHRGEISCFDEGRADLRRLISGIEEKYVPSCEYLSAASDGIGAAYRATLDVPYPVTILNVFPLSERSGDTPPEELQSERRGKGLSLYWYSQVIGRDRGLEVAIEAVALMKRGVNLHIRGAWAGGYEHELLAKMKTLGVESLVHVVPPVPPEELVERAAQHDVGLALELGETENRRIAVTNKLLNYFVAGLAIAATDVPGQRGIMERALGAGFLFKPGDAKSLADRLTEWRDSPERLSAAKSRSKALGESGFCWDKEKHKIIMAVERVLTRAPGVIA